MKFSSAASPRSTARERQFAARLRIAVALAHLRQALARARERMLARRRAAKGAR